MDKRVSYFITVFICCILLIVAFTCFFNEKQKPAAVTTKTVPLVIKADQPSILPNWTDGKYHDYFGTTKMLNGFNENYPELVKVFSIGKSVLGKDIWCIRITNEKSKGEKSSCLIDGCVHGSEWEAGEACLYLAEYLLINFDGNETITHILNSSEVYIVPLFNSDGRQIDYRFNENGIDLNRNFDIDFGRIRGCSIPLGKLFGRIKIPYIEFPLLNKWFPKIFPSVVTNSGRHPFSEPETQAMRDLMKELDKKDFSFYLNCHTSGLIFFIPWGAFKPPFEISKQEQNIYNYVIDWFVDNTEYKNVESTYKGVSYKMSGSAQDWCFKEFHIPSFAVDFLSSDLEPMVSGGKHINLVYWMKTTLPVFMYLLVNIDNLRLWRTPDIQPPLPEGVPPEPLK